MIFYIFYTIFLATLFHPITAVESFHLSSSINVDFAILGSNSAWLPSAYNMLLSRACTVSVTFLQNGWTEFLKSMKMIPKCPIAKGIYELKGYDVSNLLRYNIFPKEFFYGSYKITIEYLRFGKLVMCTYAVLQVVPDWQRRSRKRSIIIEE